MKNLQEKVEKMLQGEQKRRAIAITFLETLTGEIALVAEDLWGQSHWEYTPAIFLWKEDGNKKADLSLYFRWGTHYGTNRDEDPGFYYSDADRVWGRDLRDQRGTGFWWALRSIVEWLPLLEKEIEEKGISREKLTDRLQKMLSVS